MLYKLCIKCSWAHGTWGARARARAVYRVRAAARERAVRRANQGPTKTRRKRARVLGRKPGCRTLVGAAPHARLTSPAAAGGAVPMPPRPARALRKRDLTARDAGAHARDASPAAGHWLAPHLVQVATTVTRRHKSGRRIGGPSAKIQHLRTGTSAIEGLARMARAASVLSAWRSNQVSARRPEPRDARQKNRRFRGLGQTGQRGQAVSKRDERGGDGGGGQGHE